ncbi:MAG: DUF1499 domain-containing protein [Rhizobiaceae bacterium]|nr:DUF1499 domain-containing protein [Rhizobiaceae bacterium]
MAVLLERRVSAEARWSRRIAYFAAVLLVTSVAGHRFGAVETIALFWLFGVVVGLALVALLLSAVGFLRLWEFGDKGGRNSVKGLLAALVVLAPFGFGVAQFFLSPRLTDISTDLVDPPRFHHARAQRPAQANPIRPVAAAQAIVQIDYYPEITGRRYPLAMATARSISDAVVEQLGWTMLGPIRMGAFGGVMTLEVMAPSPWIGIVSDAAIRLTDEGETTYLDIRSVSRFGNHDLGDNAAKINRFLAAFEDEIAARNALFPAPAE